MGVPRIAVFGQTGSGKSSFICSCERALHKIKMGSAPIQTIGGEGTIILEDYLTGMPYHLLPIISMTACKYFNYDTQEINEFLSIMKGEIKSGQLIQRTTNIPVVGKPVLSYKIHSAIVLFKADDPRLHNHHLEHYFGFLRRQFRETGLNPIAVVTHKDTVEKAYLDIAIANAKQATNSAECNTFSIKNYTTEEGSNEEIDVQVLSIMKNALASAELFVKHEKVSARFKSRYFQKKY